MSRPLVYVLVIVLALFVAACTSAAPPPGPAAPAQNGAAPAEVKPSAAPATATTPPEDPEKALRAVTDFVNQGDAAGAAALLAGDPLLTITPGPDGKPLVFQGKDAIQARFKDVAATHTVNTIKTCQSEGNQVTCAATVADDTTKPLGFDLEFTVEATSENDLLKTVTWTMTADTLKKLAPPPADLNVKMDGKTCVLDKPRVTYPDKFTVSFTGGDATCPAYGLAVVSLAQGKSLFDLNHWQEATLPPWARAEATLEVKPGEQAQATVDTAAAQLFIWCYSAQPRAQAGLLGPLKVTLPAAKLPPTPRPAPTPTLLPPSDITVRMTASACQLEGKTVVPPAFTVTLMGGDKSKSEYGLSIISLAPGHTIDDMVKWKGSSQPPFVNLEGALGTTPEVGTRDQFTAGAGPLYMVCWAGGTSSDTAKVGLLGPITIAR